jgi:flagellar capping protein FliD
VFQSVKGLVDEYTQANGLIDGVKTRLTQRISAMGSQIDTMQARLAQQRDALQKQFTEADLAISRLKDQSGSLANFSTSLTGSL